MSERAPDPPAVAVPDLPHGVSISPEENARKLLSVSASVSEAIETAEGQAKSWAHIGNADRTSYWERVVAILVAPKAADETLRQLALAAQTEIDEASPGFGRRSAFTRECRPHAILTLLDERDAALTRAKNASAESIAALQAQAVIDEVISALKAECAALRATLEEEKARLDWLDAQRKAVEEHVPGRGDPDLTGYSWRVLGVADCDRSVRQAIDAARLASTETEQ